MIQIDGFSDDSELFLVVLAAFASELLLLYML